MILDEMQEVRSSTTALARLCERLSAGTRWMVSGTPLFDGIDDLNGELNFLGIWPFCTFCPLPITFHARLYIQIHPTHDPCLSFFSLLSPFFSRSLSLSLALCVCVVGCGPWRFSIYLLQHCAMRKTASGNSRSVVRGSAEKRLFSISWICCCVG